MKCRRHLLAVGALVIAIACAALPTSAQLIVFDPNNYAQNVLTAARELQQINNQITSLHNQAQMLINQAKNLASLPYSSLQQLCLLYTSPSPRDGLLSRMPSSA